MSTINLKMVWDNVFVYCVYRESKSRYGKMITIGELCEDETWLAKLKEKKYQRNKVEMEGVQIMGN